MVDDASQRRAGNENPQRYERTNDHDSLHPKLSNAANLSMATWNCGGLSKVKKDILLKQNLDIVCLTETHEWRDHDPAVIYSDAPGKNDKFSGTAIVVNRRLTSYIISSGSVGSRIVYCRLRGNSCNIFIVGVYIPQKKRKHPDQAETYALLESLLLKVQQRDCIVLMGDFNSRLPRDTDGRVGHWCIHKRGDSGGDCLLNIMQKVSLRCMSTYFQPRRNRNNATFINIQPEKAPSQIDYILVSSRWASSARTCRTKWGIAIESYGRKRDHALVLMNFKIRLRRERTCNRKDFTSLKSPDTRSAHENIVVAKLNDEPRPVSADGQWKRLTGALTAAQSALPNIRKKNGRRWETSDTTFDLVKKRQENWARMSDDGRKAANKEISRSARDDYRNHVESILQDIEEANSRGSTTEVFRLAKSLSTKRRGNTCVQPSADSDGNPITCAEEQQEAWAKFLEKKFAARPDEPEVVLDQDPDEPTPPDITLEEVQTCVKNLKSNKSSGPDSIPVEQYKSSETAVAELHQLLATIYSEEDFPEEFVLADMLMHYKKKCKDDRANYRALGLLNHSYKIFAMILLMRIMPYITPQLSDMQSGFRKGRGCRDNILMLTMIIQKLLEDAGDESRSRGIFTYIDFTAAFDSIFHSYLLTALAQYGVPTKYCRLVKAIYKSAEVRVRLQEPGGNRSYSRNVSVDRGVIQGDIPSPVCFLVALDKLLKDHVSRTGGIQLLESLHISSLEYADDGTLPDEDVESATQRLTILDAKGQQEAGMKISIAKTKVQHIRPRPSVSPTTEDDVDSLPPDKKFKHVCNKCTMSYPSKHGLSVHQGRHCKGRPTAKKPSRKGTVADRIITQMKVEQHQSSFPKVNIGSEELENVYLFNYLGADVPGDGDVEIPVKHRCDVAWGSFGEYRKTLLSTKLPVPMRIRLYIQLVVMTMTYSCEAWSMVLKNKKRLNNTSSKMLSLITKRSIHDEAKRPTFNIIKHIMAQRFEYLGHILRLENDRTLKRILLDLSPNEAPFAEGSLLGETPFQTVEEMLEAAADRRNWRELKRINNYAGESLAPLGTAA